MEAAGKRKRRSIKQSPNKKPNGSEIPPNAPKHPNIESLLRHSIGRQWIKYEWEYDDVENAFFKKSNTFESEISRHFPKLKSRALTRAEWCKIRKLLVGRKIRRFSSKFVEEQRIELEKFRRCYTVLQENNQLNVDVPMMDDFVPSPDDFEMYRLIVETKKLLAAKNEHVNKLREINNLKAGTTGAVDRQSQANATNAVTNIHSCNGEILKRMNQLVSFQLVKDALMFDAIDKKKKPIKLSPVYFLRMCEVRIYESHQEFHSDEFVTAVIKTLLDILLNLLLVIIESELLATNAVDFLETHINDQSYLLTSIITADDTEYFQTSCLPLLFVIVRKIWI